jgi:hypothetical protein
MMEYVSYVLNDDDCDDRSSSCGDNCGTYYKDEDGDMCQVNGTCGGGAKTVDCDDGNPCTDDTCDTVLGCRYAPNTAPCEDGDACTVPDVCSGGVCAGGPPVSCDDGNLCTDDSCEPAVGCVYRNNSHPCAVDDNECTDDICSGGACAHPYLAPNTSCGDRILDDCTLPDTCDGSGHCLSNDRDDGEPCTEDGDPCTEDVCISGECENLSLPDTDGDGVCDAVDNCPDIGNPGQDNSDGDSAGNACDSCPDDPTITEGPCGPSGLRVLKRWENTPPSNPDTFMRPQFNIINEGDTDIYLDNLTLRYWYTVDTGFSSQVLQCWWANWGCSYIVTSPEYKVFHPVVPPREGADYYMELSFTENRTLFVGWETGTMQLGIHKEPSYPNYILSNDYSFDFMTDWVEAKDVTLYYNGELVWGREPAVL